jgi:tetratricopeptide (TPR) repeat protein
MACGLPVIIPRGGAADDFTDETTAYYIPAGRVYVDIDIPTVRKAWALQPDTQALIEQMRYVVAHPDEAKAKGKRAGETIRATLSWEKSADIILERLQSLREKPILRFSQRKSASPDAEQARRHNEAAKQYYMSDDVEAAERLFRRAIRADASFVEPYSNLAVLYWQRGEIGAALYQLTEAMQIDPNHLDTVVNYGQICQEIGRPDVARQVFTAYLQRNPDAAEVRELLKDGAG